MTKKRLPAIAQRQILDDWRNNRDRAVDLLRSELDRLRARALLDKARQYELANGLFMSWEIRARVNSLVQGLKDYAKLLEPGLSDVPRTGEAFENQVIKFREDLQKQLRELADKLL